MFRKGDSEIIRRFVIKIAPCSNPTGSCLSVRKEAMKEGKTSEINVSMLWEHSCMDVKGLEVSDYVVEIGCPWVAESSTYRP